VIIVPEKLQVHLSGWSEVELASMLLRQHNDRASSRPVIIPTNAGVYVDSPRDTSLNRKSSIGEPLDEDDSPAMDPFFQGQLPEPRDSDEQHNEDHALIDIPDEPLLDPKDVSSLDEDRLGPDLAEGFTFEDAESARQDDYEQGPTGELGWDGLEASTDTDDDDSADGPLESLTAQLEPLQPIRADGDLEEAPSPPAR